MFTRQSAVGLELGWPLWALNPHPTPKELAEVSALSGPQGGRRGAGERLKG